MGTIFLYDDSHEDLERYGRLLRLYGHTVLDFDNHVEALAALESDSPPPDVAVLDIENQYFTGDKQGVAVGIEVGQAIKQRWAQVPIIYLSLHEHGSQLMKRVMDLKLVTWYVCKQEEDEVLTKAIELVTWNNRVVPQNWQERYSVGPLDVMPARQDASWRGQALGLTRTQFLIVHALAKEPGQLVRYTELQKVAQMRIAADSSAESSQYKGFEDDRLRNTLSRHANDIRAKLETAERAVSIAAGEGDASFDAKKILQVKSGYGYQWNPD
ncbi:MAG: response regulator transcription factor [Gammaproteobacteria bacterium]|nr:response regulator transcription factor [Gammaproteobacteria bacterium]